GHYDSLLVYNIPRLTPMQLRRSLPHRAFAQSRRDARRRKHPSPAALTAGAAANLRSTAERQQQEKPPAGEPVHTAHARQALRDRCNAEEGPMSDLAARFIYSPLLSTAFKVVYLFCLLGLALSVAIIPMIAPEHLAWVLSHIE